MQTLSRDKRISILATQSWNMFTSHVALRMQLEFPWEHLCRSVVLGMGVFLHRNAASILCVALEGLNLEVQTVVDETGRGFTSIFGILCLLPTLLPCSRGTADGELNASHTSRLEQMQLQSNPDSSSFDCHMRTLVSRKSSAVCFCSIRRHAQDVLHLTGTPWHAGTSISLPSFFSFVLYSCLLWVVSGFCPHSGACKHGSVNV